MSVDRKFRTHTRRSTPIVMDIKMASVHRRVLGERTPIQLAKAQLGDEIIERLGLKEVDASDIDLTARIRAKHR